MSSARRSRLMPRPNVASRSKQTDVENVLEAATDSSILPDSSGSSQSEGTLPPLCGVARREDSACISAARLTNNADIPDSNGGFKRVEFAVDEGNNAEDKQISGIEASHASTASAQLPPAVAQGTQGLPASVTTSTDHSSDTSVENNTRRDELLQLSSVSTCPISRSPLELPQERTSEILSQHPDSRRESPLPSLSPRDIGSLPFNSESAASVVAASSSSVRYGSSDHPDAYQPESAPEASHCKSSLSTLPARRPRIVARPSVNPKQSAPGASQRRLASGLTCDKVALHPPLMELALGHERSKEGRLPQCGKQASTYLTSENSQPTDGDASSGFKDGILDEDCPVVNSSYTETAAMTSHLSVQPSLGDRPDATFRDTSLAPGHSMLVLDPSLTQPAVALGLVDDTMPPSGCEASSEFSTVTAGVSRPEDTENLASNDRPSAAAASSRRPRIVARPNVKLNDRAVTAGAGTLKVSYAAVADMDPAVEDLREFSAIDVTGNMASMDDQHQDTLPTAHDTNALDELTTRAEGATSSDFPDQSGCIAGGKPRPRLKIKPNVTSELSRAKQVRPVGASDQLAEAQSPIAVGLTKDSADLIRCSELSAGIHTSHIAIRHVSSGHRSDKIVPNEMPVGNFSIPAAVPAPRKRPRRKVVQSDQPPDRTKMTMKELLYWTPKSNHMTKPPGQPIKYSMQNSSVAQKTSDSTHAVSPGHAHESDMDESDDPVPQVMVGEDGQLMINESSLVVRSAPIDHPTAADVIVEDQRTYVTSGSFRNRLGTKFWTPQDTCKFYRALSYVGTDFSMMERFFPLRSRSELKNKFKKEEKFNKKQVDAALVGKLCFDAEAFTDSEHSSDESSASCSTAKDRGKKLSRCSDANLSKKRKTFEDDSDISTSYDDDSRLTSHGNMPSGSEVAVEPLTDNVQHSKSQNADFTPVLPDFTPAQFGGGSRDEAEKTSMADLPAVDPLNVEAGQLIFVVSDTNAEDSGVNSTETAQQVQQVIHVYVVSPPD